MSVQGHLSTTASNLILTPSENASITTSVTTLRKRLTEYFGTNLKEQFMFGSYTRGTILPRKVDSNSDVDYMLVFDNSGNLKPQSFLDRVKKFATKKYSTSEIYQSHPTIVLELNHIKFELVPAYNASVAGYYIPQKGHWGDTWMYTNPMKAKTNLTNKNIYNNFLIKPLVRLMKYWSAINNVYESYEVEEYIINQYYPDKNLKDMLYSVVDGLQTGHLSLANKAKVDRLKKIINATRELEDSTDAFGWIYAEDQIQKAFPVYTID